MLEIGNKAPGFCLFDKENKEFCLDDLKDKWTVLYFYPKDNTPGCTQEACDFSVNITDFQDLDAVVVGISPDSTESHKKFAEKYSLEVTLLSDKEHQIIEQYDAWQLKKMMGKEYMGVARSTFIIDPVGNIAAIWKNVSVKGHIVEVREKLKEVQKG